MKKVNNFKLDEFYSHRITRLSKLMHFKIREILLVSSLYDNYLFEEDGRLYELLREEYQALNLSQSPEITHVSTGEEAFEIIQSDSRFDMIIMTLHIEDMHPVRLAQMIRQAGNDIPILLLAYDNKERKDLVTHYDTSIFSQLFIWTGDYRLLMACIKSIEDKINLENDVREGGVQVIIVIEDNVKFYSMYLPIIYTEIFRQSQRLIAEGISLTHRFLRMRARPKILLCTNYDEAWAYFEKYKEHVLGVITDVNYKRNRVKDPEAGISFARAVKALHKDISILIQSSNAEYEPVAHSLGASFLLKGSPRLLHQLQEFMLQNFGFGDFVFRNNRGEEVARAHDLNSLEECLRVVPEETIEFHASRNHFSNWLKARTEFWLADRLRPKQVSDFGSVNALRDELINSLRIYKKNRMRGVLTDFNRETFDPRNSFARIGGGSLGGKARGLGFVNQLINNYLVRDKFSGVEVMVPSGVVLSTEVFDRFLQENNLEAFALNEEDDREIMRRFVEAPAFPEDVVWKLIEFLDIVHEPLAVRSSSLLEDSQFQPFAGVYDTHMIANSNPDTKIRLDELLYAVKAVYASTFFKKAKDYMKATAYRMEEEKMAVIIQKLVGRQRHNRFYPDFAGVAKSHNFYPIAPQKASDGLAMVALGLGKTVVEGHNSVRFCPKYPRHLLQFFSAKESLRSAQTSFFYLDMNDSLNLDASFDPDSLVKPADLAKAEEDGALYYTGSTYSPENEAVYDGISRSGRRLVTFAPILKHGVFPLAEILDDLLTLGSWGMGTQVEIEFAVNMDVPPGQPKEFAMLQMRPLVINREVEQLDLGREEPGSILLHSSRVLGNGVSNDIHDIVLVDIHKFDRGRSREVAAEISRLNAKLLLQKKPYLLIGVGRWGTFDQWLGIPVTWDQISGAGVIVESGFKDMNVTPSQGSHFFQNITSFRVGYFTVNPHEKIGQIDWDWLLEQTPVEELDFTRHLAFSSPVVVKINGHQNKGLILKPV